jgi:hypothetical protein
MQRFDCFDQDFSSRGFVMFAITGTFVSCLRRKQESGEAHSSLQLYGALPVARELWCPAISLLWPVAGHRENTFARLVEN